MVSAVCSAPTHSVRKPSRAAIHLLAGLGVEGDAHLGETVQHRFLKRRHPQQPNLRQVHLLAAELLDELAAAGYDVCAGQLGENVTTLGLDLVGLPARTRLHVGEEAVIEVTGLRDPCVRLERIGPGLMAATLARDERGGLVRRAGVMGIVLTGGRVRPGDPVAVERPAPPHHPLRPV